MILIENVDVYGFEAAIRGYPEYKITINGDVIGKRGKPLVGHVDRSGYREVILSYYPNFQKQCLVHRLVLSTFNPIDDMEKYDVNHKNGNKLDNRLENLEWCTRSENIKHSYKNKLQNRVGNRYGNFNVLNEDDLSLIYELHKQGYADMYISKEIGCSRSLVSRKIREMGVRNDKD